jgi:hypothetical protein
MAPKPTAPITRLLNFVHIEPEGGCWTYRGMLDEWGYGKIKIAGRKHRTHRVAYEAIVGPIPDGLTIDHLCRNRACCNPDHLEPVTRSENYAAGERQADPSASPDGPLVHNLI